MDLRADADPMGEERTGPPSPPARRLRAPSWLDLRLVLGVLLVLVAVVVGARVLAGADKSTTVWGLAHDVSAGTTIQDEDLHQVKIRFYSDADQYLLTSSSPVGLVTTRDLHAGELLPRPALQKVPTSVLVPVPVEPAQLPPGLTHGDRVNVWAGPKNPGSGTPPKPTLILSGVAVQAVDSGGSGLSASNNVQVTLRIEPQDESKLVAAVAGSTIYLVQDLGRPPTDATPHS
ncbi:MAG TPA: hypothetical protein VHC49_02460 [Mycobacteriales bacterium]|nr:hypothetical protein [Mycobacteriales bacterium]